MSARTQPKPFSWYRKDQLVLKKILMLLVIASLTTSCADLEFSSPTLEAVCIELKRKLPTARPSNPPDQKREILDNAKFIKEELCAD
jgi:hypothetical protein